MSYPRDLLPSGVLAYEAIKTHVHPGGNSDCSGQQTIEDIVTAAQDLGYIGVVVTPHTGNPTAPFVIEPSGPEVEALRLVAKDVDTSGLPVQFGLETNLVQRDDGFVVDTADTILSVLDPVYIVKSIHGRAEGYKTAAHVMAAVETITTSYPGRPSVFGHPTRYISDVEVDWEEIAELCAIRGVRLELNLNLWFKETGQNNVYPKDHFNWKFWRHFMRLTARTNVRYVIGGDEHNAGQWTTPEPIQGWEMTVRRHLEFVDELDRAGISPDRVENSSAARWLNFTA